jgi:glycosyltransferase involved in cell wall biosynthesis
MKIWIINPFDNLPVEGYRPQRYWLMAEAFVAAGHDVVLWTQNWSHAKKARREELPSQTSFELKYVSVPGYGSNISLKRVWSHWRFAKNWRKTAEAQEEKPQLIIVSSPPLYIGKEVRTFCKEYGAKYIVDIMDAWPETFERVVPQFVLAPLKKIAKENYLQADGITAVTKSYLKMAEEYGATAPMHLCYHGIKDSSLNEGKGETHQKSEYLNLVYIGNMSLSYDLSTVIESVKKDDCLKLDIAGAGPDETRLRTLAEGCERISFHGYLDSDGVKSLLLKADVGLVPMFSDSCVGVPYKLADYVAASLPVLNSLEGETKDLLEECGAGVTYKARDVDSFRLAIKKVRNSIDEISSNVKQVFNKFNAESIYPLYVSFAEAIMLKTEESPKKVKSLFQVASVYLILGFLFLYAFTAQRGVSWGEAGLFQFRILTHDLEGFAGLALAHPLYIMVGSVASLIVPEQYVFWFMNFFSGVWTSLTLIVLSRIVYELTKSVKASLLAVLTFGLSHMVWYSSTMSEVYTMSLFFIALETFIFIKFIKTSENGYLIPLAFFNGLGLSVHNFSLLALPVYAFVIASKFITQKKCAFERVKAIGAYLLSFAFWVMGLMPLLILAIKSYSVSHDIIQVLKSLLFGQYAQVVAGVSNVNVKGLIVNYLIASLSFILPGWFYLFKKSNFSLKSSVDKSLFVLFLIHFTFWVRYFVPDQATFILPTLFFAMLLISRSLANVKRVKTFVFLTLLLSVGVPFLVTYIGKKLPLNASKASLPYRDEIEYFAQPWKMSEHSAEKFVFKVASEVNGFSTLYADITPMAPLGCAKKMNWLPRSLQLHDKYFNGGHLKERKGDKYFEVRPIPPYRISPKNWKVERPHTDNILFRLIDINANFGI